MLDRLERVVNRMLPAADLPVYKEQPGGNGTAFPEVMKALTGGAGDVVRVSEQGELIVSVAVPIQRFRAVLGVLLLSTQGGDIDKIVAAERMAILRVFGVAALVTVVLSMLLASHHRQAAAPAVGGGRPGAPRRSRAARRFPISPTARTRSAISRSRCAT